MIQEELEKHFNSRFSNFYKPENSDDGEAYTFLDMQELCEDEWQHSRILAEKFTSPDDLLHYMITFIDWEYPETFIEQLKIFD